AGLPKLVLDSEWNQMSHRWCRLRTATSQSSFRRAQPQTKTGRCEHRVPCLEPALATYRRPFQELSRGWLVVPRQQWIALPPQSFPCCWERASLSLTRNPESLPDREQSRKCSRV